MEQTIKKLKAMRKDIGLTQTEMARILGVGFATVNRWENKWCWPSPLGLATIKNTLGIYEAAKKNDPKGYRNHFKK